jgi:alpha-tubulin suppressor-like RCC1 family protein
MQYSLKPLQQFTYTVVSVALGQDHSLALTKSGEVFSWGLNRFSQIGYVVESSSTSDGSGSRLEEPIQATPRKVLGPLKKDIVHGVAASKGASACWTATDIFTWGTNNGQLGDLFHRFLGEKIIYSQHRI